MSGRIRVKIDPNNFNPQKVLDDIAAAAKLHFDTKVGPHVVDVARKRAPVGKERNFNPQLRSGSFQKVELVDKVPAGRNVGGKIERLRALREGTTEVNLDTDAEFFKISAGSKKKPNRDAGRTPDVIAFRRGTVVGAAMHRPGTLRDSIHYAGSRREGPLVIGTVEATAPYAAAVHDGFTHKGGQSHKGKATQIPGKPFLATALDNAEDDLVTASNYQKR